MRLSDLQFYFVHLSSRQSQFASRICPSTSTHAKGVPPPSTLSSRLPRPAVGLERPVPACRGSGREGPAVLLCPSDLTALNEGHHPPPCHPVDKPKGVVKGVDLRRVAMSNSLAMSLETWRHASPLRESFSVERVFHQPSIRTNEASMINFSNIAPSARCGGAHSSERLSLSPPRDDAGCPR